jgi:hypothetical protein
VDALTPIPQAPPEGSGVGVPVLVGGEDLQDSAATLVSYPSDGGPREVLLATVNEEAEAKLMEALAVSGTTMVPVQTQQQITGRLPLDEEKELYEKVAKAAKSVNDKLGKGVDIPEHTKQYWQEAKQAVFAVADDPDATDDEKVMASYYAGQLGVIHASMTDPAVGKVPFVDAHQVDGTVTVTTYVPAPDMDATGLPAILRDAGRISPHLDADTGISSWDGKSRKSAHGKEYLIDLGDGYSAVYRPYAANDPAQHEFSLRGQLEVHAPTGAGHGEELVQRLGQLHLVNRPMTAAEGEWTYLCNNITAQSLGGNADVSAAVATAKHLEDLQLQEIFHAKAHQAVGLDEAGLHKLARDFQLEAAARCLPKKVRMVRSAVAKATGFASGTDLAESPGYDPLPKRSGGWLTWGRFDVTGKSGEVKEAWKGKRLACQLSSSTDMASLFTTGVFASTERRQLLGVSSGTGMSESEDKKSGGANSVFLRVRYAHAMSGPALIWDDPTTLLSRSDYYAYDGDHFGSLNPKSGKSTSGMTRDPLKIAQHSAHNNEIMFRHGLDLLGAEAPSRIVCSSSKQRQQLLSLFADRGITHLGGKPVDQIVKA